MTKDVEPQPADPAARPGQPDPVDGPSGQEAHRSDGIRETIESIVVAFILAFVFRAFVVEAFVIPTGSMAPSLYGQHGQYRCQTCQYPFAYGVRESVRLPHGNGQNGTLAIRGGFTVQCPNCGWTELDNKLNSSEETRVVSNSGDRILVLKWPYDIGGGILGPQRWDVVVFKDPQDGETNFIKRLLGLPGEVLEIINGDIYAAPLEDVPKDIIETLMEPPRARSGRPIDRLTQEQHARLAKALKIQRKTKTAQESLWLIHYDHDYIPDPAKSSGNRLFPRWQPRGEAVAAWDVSTPRVSFQPDDNREHWLDLSGKPIQDTYGYNSVNRRNSRQGPCSVGDVRLRFVLFPGFVETDRELGPGRDAAERYLVLSLSKGQDEFWATIWADGTVELAKSGRDDIRVPLRTARIAPLRPDAPLSIELENLDYRITLRVDDIEILATDEDSYHPPVLGKLLSSSHQNGGRANRAKVAIGAKGLPLELRHLNVHRDVFYRSTDVVLDRGNPLKNKINDYAGYPGWGTAGNPILLRDDPPDYFCCGDNSPQSKDSRLWWEVCPMLEEREGEERYQYGTVPGDQMIGRAFFVYWPGGLRFLKETPAVIPNVGRMRIIR
jgi:signal peptidase I